jgi:hypothetical protein
VCFRERPSLLPPDECWGLPWGVLVTVSGGATAYGEWPLSDGGGSPTFQKSALVRIRRRWHDHGPLSALENAIEIIHAYNRRPARRRQAA